MKTARNFSQSKQKFPDFWKSFKQLSEQKGISYFPPNMSLDHGNWIRVPSGVRGVYYNFIIHKDNAGIQLSIMFNDKEKNKKFFDKLYLQKEFIEKQFGKPLVWARLDKKNMSRIYCLLDTGGYQTQSQWKQIQNEMIKAMERFRKIMQPLIEEIAGRI